jgi:predicted HicB family RNase H-like nuclease
LAFKDTVESYLGFCHRKGITEMQKSYTGIFNIRIDADLHHRAAIMAKTHGVTLNTFVKKAIEQSLEYI